MKFYQSAEGFEKIKNKQKLHLKPEPDVYIRERDKKFEIGRPDIIMLVLRGVEVEQNPRTPYLYVYALYSGLFSAVFPSHAAISTVEGVLVAA